MLVLVAAAVAAEALTVQQAWAASGMECGLEVETGIAASEAAAITTIAMVPSGTTVEDVVGCRSKRFTAAAVTPEAAASRERLIVFEVGGSLC